VVCLGRPRETSKSERRRPSLEVADIFRAHGDEYRQRYALTGAEFRVFHDICACRTEVLGGHLDVCPDCDFQRPAYNSCRNRHCPKCQAMRKAAWIDDRMARILGCPYFHCVFTLPAELRPLARRHPRLLYGLLFQAASQTLLALGEDPKHLGAQLGVTAVLHTWTRSLSYHPHLHCVVTGGGLSRDGQRWIPVRQEKYLFPVRVLGNLFRGKFLAGLRQLHQRGRLDLGAAHNVKRLLDRLYRTKWVVYAKPPFGGPQEVYRYLGRYTHRIGISNYRLVSLDDSGVTFRTKNGKTVTVAAVKFIRRFLLHVLPKGFVRLRHYGLMAPANVNTRLETARELLDKNGVVLAEPDPEPPADRTWVDRVIELTGKDPTRCPTCKAKLLRRPLPAPTSGGRAPPALLPALCDTS